MFLVYQTSVGRFESCVTGIPIWSGV